MGIFRSYARLVLFVAGVLLGVQVPNFVDQYFKRVSAHRLEAMANFRGFEETATRHFGGDVRALLEHYKTSPDPVFRDDARTIETILDRYRRYSEEMELMDASLVRRIVHVAFSPDREILGEVIDEYSATVPLDQSAILCGLVLGLLLSMLVEFVLLGLAGLAGLAWQGMAQKPAPASPTRK
jgi:hypothetical protein